MSQDRREFLRSLTATMLGPAAVHASGRVDTAPLAETPSHGGSPNVILMICDDLGYGDLGCYGSSIPTPRLDKLALEGVRCSHYNTPHPICSASRSALLTGRYAPRTRTPGALFPKAAGTSLDETMLPALFRAKGYRTHAVGKWHLGDVAGYLPTDRGFDSFYGVPYSDDMQPLPLMRGTEALEADTDRDELTPQYTAETLRLLEEKSDKPFFLYLAYSYPHDPARGSKAFRGRSAFGDYGDAVEEIDWSVGKILDALERTGKGRDTVVIFTSDHGPWFQGSHGLTRGRKGSCFEGGVRVPFLVRYPGHVPAKTVNDAWMGHLDVMPTLSAWCGLELPKKPLDGSDVSASLLRKAALPERSMIYFSPAGGKNAVHAIRAGDWKLRVAQNDGEIYTNDHTQGPNNFWLPKPELYHLRHDPMENYSATDKNPEVVERLLNELRTQMKTFPEATQKGFAELQAKVASVVTPPGAAPRVLTGAQPAWAWEPPDRRP
jgi:arylsulfatase A